jgi:hypothetical protein
MAVLAHAETDERDVSQKNVARLVVATSLGNALEWFDISVCAYFAVYLSKAFWALVTTRVTEADKTFNLDPTKV